MQFLWGCVVMRCFVNGWYSCHTSPTIHATSTTTSSKLFCCSYTLRDWHRPHTRWWSMKRRNGGCSGTKVQTKKCNDWTEADELYENECTKSETCWMKQQTVPKERWKKKEGRRESADGINTNTSSHSVLNWVELCRVLCTNLTPVSLSGKLHSISPLVLKSCSRIRFKYEYWRETWTEKEVTWDSNSKLETKSTWQIQGMSFRLLCYLFNPSFGQ